jgi:hypothetical protein
MINGRFQIMSPELKTIEDQAMALPAEDRERLASHLFRSLNAESLNQVDLDWLELAEKRFQALKNGTDVGLSEEAFFKALA